MLEVLYHIPKSNIFYLHNNANDYSCDLIFGHGESDEKQPKEDDLDENGYSRRKIFTDAEDGAWLPFMRCERKRKRCWPTMLISLKS